MNSPRIEYTIGSTTHSVFLNPISNLVGYSQPRQAVYAVASSGVEDAWIPAHDHLVEGDLRYIPSNTTVNPVASGWSEVQSFLEYGRQAGTFRFYPDGTSASYFNCTLSDPVPDIPGLEVDGTHTLHVLFRNVDGVPMDDV